MEKIFKIAAAEYLGNILYVGKKSKVTEDIFWKTLGNQIKELTKDLPNQYDETYNNARTFLLAHPKTNVTVGNIAFEIINKK